MEPKESGRKLKGCLLPPGDLSAPRPLRPGDPVMAQYLGNPRHAWYAGTATEHNADGSWRIEYEDGDVEDLPVVSAASKLPCVKHRDGTPVQKPVQKRAAKHALFAQRACEQCKTRRQEAKYTAVFGKCNNKFCRKAKDDHYGPDHLCLDPA